MYLQSVLTSRPDDFKQLCRRNKVFKLYAFGSAVKGGFELSKSDVDLLVSLDISDPIIYGETLLSLWDDLELFFGLKVDLLTAESLKNPYLKQSIEEAKILIYDAAREEVFV